MNTKRSLTILVLLFVLFLTGCGAKAAPVVTVPDGAQAGDLTGLEKCNYEAKGEKFAAECGTLVVPENWDKDGSRLIALPVVSIPASGANPAEPVFFLNGGPGSPNLVWAPPDWILKDHDVVMVGYRGMEGSVKLDCPELNDLVKVQMGNDLFGEQARNDYVEAAKQCAIDLQKEGVDISGYTVPGVVEDLESARKALGYGRINLFSLSYGTRVAQIYTYVHPDSLSRLVLIGVNTPGHFIWDRYTFDKMIRQMSELCAKDVSCSSRTSDFAQTMYDVNRNMPERWFLFNIDPGTVRFATQMTFFFNQMMPMTFEAYLLASEGDPSGLAMLNLLMKLLPAPAGFADQFSKGGSLDRYEGLESVDLGDSVMGAPLAEFVWPIAKEWPIELLPQELREIQDTDVEMLLVNGTVDFSTPPTALVEAKPYYHNAQMVLLPQFGHEQDVQTLQPEAFERLITSYYDTGVADDSLFVYQPLSFKPGISLTTVARILIALMFVLPALIVWGFVSIVHRIRRRRATNQ